MEDVHHTDQTVDHGRKGKHGDETIAGVFETGDCDTGLSEHGRGTLEGGVSMGKQKITCNNSSCKHHRTGGKCETCITITPSGKCGSFEKGFVYYFHIVWDALENKNYIDMVEVQQNPDLKIGLYYVMECYGLGFSEMEWGTCRILMLKNGEKGEPLKYERSEEHTSELQSQR